MGLGLLFIGAAFFGAISPAKAHAAPAIYISNNMDSGDLSTVDVEVQISAVMTAKGYVPASTVFNNEQLQLVQVGQAWWIEDSNGKELYQIPDALYLKIIDAGSGHQLGTYCTSNDGGSTFQPCAEDDTITPTFTSGDPLSSSGPYPYTLEYSAYFSATDENGASNYPTSNINYYACPSGPNITLNRSCPGKTPLKYWTVESCTYNSPPGLDLFGSNCVTSLGLTTGGNPNHNIPSSITLGLPLTKYTPVTERQQLSSDQTTPTCENQAPDLGWIMCPVYEGAAHMCDWLLTNLVQPLLVTDPISTNPANTTYQIWSNFRIYGNVVLVIALLVLVFGEVIGGGVIDAYTAKKMLPRILMAAILINLSVYIVALLVDMTNVIGGGIGQLLTSPIAQDAQFKFTLTQSGANGVGLLVGSGSVFALTAGIISTGVLGAAVGFIMLFAILPAVLGLLAAFIVILLRKAIILFLVLISPIAFALFCLPNTEKYFRKWWDLLLQTLMVYPIIMIMFAVADILSVTIQQANSSSGIGGGPLLSEAAKISTIGQGLAALIAFVCLFLPLMLIPFAFRMAGGALGKISEVVGNNMNKVTEAIKGNINDPNSLRNKTKRNLGQQVTRGQNRVIQAGRDMKAPALTRARGKIAGLGVFGNVDQRMATYNKAAAQRREDLTSFGDDTLVYAGAGYMEDGKYFDAKGRQISRQTYKRGKSLYGGSQHDISQALTHQLGKALTQDDVAQYRKAFRKNAINEGWSDKEVAGVHAAVTYPHKSVHPSEWYSKPKLLSNGDIYWEDVSQNEGAYGEMVTDLAARPAYELSRVSADDWAVQADHQTRAGRKFEAIDAVLRSGETRQVAADGTVTVSHPGKVVEDHATGIKTVYDEHDKVTGSVAQTADGLTAYGADGRSVASVSTGELRNFAKTDEILDSMVAERVMQVSSDGEVQVAGASPEAQKIIGAMYNSQQYRVGATEGGTNTSQRAVYRKEPVKAAREADSRGETPTQTRARINRVITANTLGTIDATGDQTRPAIINADPAVKPPLQVP